MKTVYFVRHAKSNWDHPNLVDHDRPLDARGIHDAPRMAQRLLELGVSPAGLLTSTAKRARQTAQTFREAFGLPEAAVITESELYHAWPDTIEEHVQNLPADWDTVLVFGHNPGYTDLANRLKHDSYIDNVPTCGIIGAQADVPSWADFRLSTAKRTLFLYPKQT